MRGRRMLAAMIVAGMFAHTLAVWAGALAPLTFASPPPFCRPGQDPSTCLPWRPRPGTGDGGRGTEDEGPLRGMVATPETVGRILWMWVTPVWTMVCDKHRVRICWDRVCVVRAQRCWSE